MTTSAASAAAPTTPATPTTLNRIETHKLYMTLLQFSLYDNPYKHYSRKIKLKKVPPLHSGASASSASHSGTPVEYIIVSSYPSSGGSASLRSADAAATTATATLKPRKKMKVTGAPPLSTDIEPECEPESPKSNKIVEEEQQTNIIIFKPI